MNRHLILKRASDARLLGKLAAPTRGVYSLDDFLSAEMGITAREEGVLITSAAINDILTIFVADDADAPVAATQAATFELILFSI